MTPQPKIKTHAELHAMYASIAERAHQAGYLDTARWAADMRDRYAPSVDGLMDRFEEMFGGKP